MRCALLLLACIASFIIGWYARGIYVRVMLT